MSSSKRWSHLLANQSLGFLAFSTSLPHHLAQLVGDSISSNAVPAVQQSSKPTPSGSGHAHRPAVVAGASKFLKGRELELIRCSQGRRPAASFQPIRTNEHSRRFLPVAKQRSSQPSAAAEAGTALFFPGHG